LLTLQIKTARKFKPLLEPSRYKGAYGGRGSAKSHFFSELMIEHSATEKGLRSVCIREVQRTLKDSSKRLLEYKLDKLGFGRGFRVFNDRIATPGDGLIIFMGMQDHTADSIKSLEGFQRAWIDEAQLFSARSLTLLRPTIRAENSEIWASWNPRRKTDAIDDLLRGPNKPKNAIVVEANWRDNPWFPKVLEDERRHDLEHYPERYEHIWEGGYAKAFEGAYFAKGLAEARAKGRIGKVETDPLLPVRLYWDLGGSGANADAMSIWAVQFVGREIRLLHYLEGTGQVLAYYVNELRRLGYGKSICRLPHDGVNENNVTGKRYCDHLKDAEFDVPPPIENQGRGAAMMRVEAARRIFSQCWFNELTCEPGLDALGYYHERKDEARNVGLGPEHDWSSHGADAFGLMAVDYEAPSEVVPRKRVAGRGGWMGG
jgi:phage terminase large subunit